MLSRRQITVWMLGVLHAGLFVLALPPCDLWFLAFVSPAPLALLAIHARTTRGGLFIAYVTQFLMWMWLLRWIIPVTALGYPFLAMYMSIWPTLAVWILRRVSRHAVLGAWPMALLLPVIWVGVEYFRGDVLFHGYPWYLLGHPLIAVSFFVQSADLFGTYFMSFLTAMAAGLIVDFCRLRLREQTQSRKPLRFAALSVTGVLAFNAVYGICRLNQASTFTAGPRVLAIQTNLPQSNKVAWSEEEKERDIASFMAMTREAIAQLSPPPDLVVWPETMVPGAGFEPSVIASLRELHEEDRWGISHLYRWPLTMIEFQREIGIPLVIGSESWTDTAHIIEDRKIRFQPSRTFNSAYLLTGQPPFQRYDKFFLTPFGETMPYISEWPWLEGLFLKLAVGADLAFNLDSNPEIAILKLSNGDQGGAAFRIGTPICFEDTVARFCRRMTYKDGKKAVDVLINVSNEGWFGESDSDRKLHAISARFRAIENRVPMVRSANTGLSLWIDSAGRIKSAIGEPEYGTPRQVGWIVADVQLDSRQTLYSRVGESWPTACLLATAIGLGWTFRRSKVVAKTAEPKRLVRA